MQNAIWNPRAKFKPYVQPMRPSKKVENPPNKRKNKPVLALFFWKSPCDKEQPIFTFDFHGLSYGEQNENVQTRS